jgi:hypothetical protein
MTGSLADEVFTQHTSLGLMWICASPAREKPVHYCVRNAFGTTIAKLKDATKRATGLAYKHFNQQALGVVQTCLYRLPCESKQLGKLLRRDAVDNAGHQHDAQIIEQQWALSLTDERG